MKIAIEIDPYLRAYSGIKVYFTELVSRLHLYDDLDICGHLFNFAHWTDTADARHSLHLPITDNPLLSYGLYRRLWHICPLDYQKLFPTQAQVTHFFSYAVPPRVCGRILTTVYDLTYLRYPETMQERNRHFLQKEMLSSAQRSDLILTISQFSKEEIVNLLHIPPEKIRVIHPAAKQDFPVDKEYYSTVARQFGIAKPYILYLGTLEPRKNLIRLIRAFKRLRGGGRGALQLVLAGAPGWKAKSILSETGGSKDLILTGHVNEEQKATLLANASAFAYVSLYEGFGIPVLEAMRAGVPTVCANTSALPEVAGDGALLVNPFSEAQIAEGLDAVLSDLALARHLSAQGARQAERFNWDRSSAQLANIYRGF